MFEAINYRQYTKVIKLMLKKFLRNALKCRCHLSWKNVRYWNCANYTFFDNKIRKDKICRKYVSKDETFCFYLTIWKYHLFLLFHYWESILGANGSTQRYQLTELKRRMIPNSSLPAHSICSCAFVATLHNHFTGSHNSVMTTFHAPIFANI